MELTLKLVDETDLALGLTEGIGHKKVFWLPKSQIKEIDRELADGNIYITLEVPEWMAKEKGLIK